MNKPLIGFILCGLRKATASVLLLFTVSFLTILLFVTLEVVNINKSMRLIPASMSVLNSQALPVPTVTLSPTVAASNSTSSSPNDGSLNIAEFVIYWSGAFLAVVTVLLAIAAIFGILELRSIGKLREEVTTQTKDLLQQVADLKKRIEDTERLAEKAETKLTMLVTRFESDSQKLMDITYTFTEANIAYNLGNNKRAIDYFLRVLDMQPDNLRVMERLGRAYSNLNKLTEAVYYLNKALTIDPKNVPALRSLGLCHRYANPAEAINKLQQALTIEPKDFESWDFLGLIYRDQKLYEDAIAAHEKALQLKRRPETQFYLSILYFLTGDAKRGRLMAMNAENELQEHEHQERIRPVWKILMSAALPIIDSDEHEALRLIQSLKPYITSNRIYDGLMAHLEILLSVTGHKDWISKFTEILQVKEQ